MNDDDDDSASPTNPSAARAAPSRPPATPSSQPPTPASSPSPAAAPSAAAQPSPVAWWTRPITRWLALLVATAVVFYLCWLMLEPFVDVLIWAAVLVVVFYPVHQRILARLGRPGWSAALSCA